MVFRSVFPLQLVKYSGKAIFGLSVKCWTNCVSDVVIAATGALFGMGTQILQGLATLPIELWLGKLYWGAPARSCLALCP